MTDYRNQFEDACRGGHLEEVKQLVQNHPEDVNLNYGFEQAYKHGQIEIAKWIINKYQANNHENNVKTFRWACENGQIEIAKWMVNNYQVDVHFDSEYAFQLACRYGQLEIAEWLVRDHQVDVHADNELAFKSACYNEHIEIAKWLVHDHQVNVHLNNEHVFRWACIHKHIKIINWFIDEYKYSQSPYYYHNRTGYILNHEPLKKWQSCTILGCPVIYHGELDEPAVIAYMATLKKPKSARS